jgi:small subunit ribosomal protein S8
MKYIISKFITIMRNALLVKQQTVQIQFTNELESILNCLTIEGFIQNFVKITLKEKVYFMVSLKYYGTKRISIIKSLNIPSVLNNKTKKNNREFTLYFLSTSKGILTNVAAKNLKIGGEILFSII